MAGKYKNNTTQLRRCIDCGIAKVYQFGYNPIIAACDDGTKNVAQAPHHCNRFRMLAKIRCIENYQKKYWFEKK